MLESETAQSHGGIKERRKEVMQRWKTETTELIACKGSRKEGVVKEGENRETALRFI